MLELSEEQDAGVMVRRFNVAKMKDSAQKQRLRDVVPEGIKSTVNREEDKFGF